MEATRKVQTKNKKALLENVPCLLQMAPPCCLNRQTQKLAVCKRETQKLTYIVAEMASLSARTAHDHSETRSKTIQHAFARFERDFCAENSRKL